MHTHEIILIINHGLKILCPTNYSSITHWISDNYNQWLIIWLPVDYLLIMITHLFHWCHPLVMSGNFYFHFPLSYKKTSHLIRLINGEFFLFLLISPCVKKKCPIFLLSFLCHFPLLLGFTMVNFCNFCRK